MSIQRIHPNKLKKIKSVAINIAVLLQKEYQINISTPITAFLDVGTDGIFVDTLATKDNKSYMITDGILDKNPLLNKDLIQAKSYFNDIRKEINILSKVYNVPTKQIWDEIFTVLEDNI